MSAFEFLFSFYGLLLGLALTEVVAGVSRAVNARRTRPIGWLTPLLAMVLVLDLMTFWATAWRDMREITFHASLLLSAGVAPLVYYFAAKQAFPEPESEVASLDDHFFQHRIWVLGGVIIANQLSYLPTITEPDTLRSMVNNSVYVLPLLAAALLRVRWMIAAIFVGEIAWLIWLLTVAI